MTRDVYRERMPSEAASPHRLALLVVFMLLQMLISICKCHAFAMIINARPTSKAHYIMHTIQQQNRHAYHGSFDLHSHAAATVAAINVNVDVEHDETAEAEVDWKLYTLQQKYKRSGGILYKQSILTPDEYTSILNELQSMNLMMKDEKESSFASNRVGAEIINESEIYKILSSEDGSLCRLISSLADADRVDDDDDDVDDVGRFGKMILAPEIPIEVRVYEKAGAGMEWHIDDILYNPKQIEVVLTLENNSDCYTMWRPQPIVPATSTATQHEGKDGNDGMSDRKTIKYEVQSAQTTPNSALILKAGGVEHKVSPLTVGKRTILKMAFVREGAVVVEGMEGHASHHQSPKKKKKKQKGGKKMKKR